MLLELLPEIVEQVIGYCDISDLKNLQCTCSTYHEILKQFMWETVKINHSNLMFLKHNDKRLENLQYTQNLRLCSNRRHKFLEGMEKVSANYKRVLQYCNPMRLDTLFIPKDVYSDVAKLDHLIELNFSESDVDDSNLHIICENLYGLKILHLSSTNITDYGLQLVYKLVALEELIVSRCLISDDALWHISHLPQLKRLDVACCWQVGNQGVSFLSTVITLEELHLSNCDYVTDMAIPFLNPLVSLNVLSLNHIKITDTGILGLCSFTNLKELAIAGTAVSDQCLSYICKLSSLEHLDVMSTDITDNGLRLLASMKSLRRLNCEFTDVSSVGISKLLKDKLSPDLKVYANTPSTFQDTNVED